MFAAHRRHKRGFTLPESIVALTIVALAVGVFGAAFPASSQAISRARNADRASDGCQEQMDFWRQVGYSSLPAIPGGATSLTQTFTPPANLPGRTGTVKLTRVDAGFAATAADTGRMKVEVTISWHSAGSDHGSVTLTSLILR